MWRGETEWKTKLQEWNKDSFYVVFEFDDPVVCIKIIGKKAIVFE